MAERGGMITMEGDNDSVKNGGNGENIILATTNLFTTKTRT